MASVTEEKIEQKKVDSAELSEEDLGQATGGYPIPRDFGQKPKRK